MHIPFGYLFLSEPPQETMPLPDLRTLGDVALGEISVDLRDVILDAQRKQAWYKEYAIQQGIEILPFVGRFSLADTPQDVARNISQILNIDDALRRSIKNWEAFLSALVEKAEGVGILMMHSGIVGSNTHRPLNVGEFRGFAISDPIAPLVFLNWKDAKAARIFTLVHELAHIWIGQSGISDVALNQETTAIHMDSERFCNAVAAEVLVPEQSFRERWNKHANLADNAYDLVRYYRVSSIVIGRRACDLGLVTWDEFRIFYQDEARRWIQQSGKNGGDYYLTARTRLGRRFASAVIASVQQGSLLFRDAGQLLDMNPAKIPNLARELKL
ncbi:ImmA/IrrE family metallo-endopeptidase [methane-oxidizing endosymbiont of Gigantopelta aegis]|uniref:ImmA/IrrE family metallo-endopeptidase n=1 Tax=methane-oxidizing endosymbiont of Gigantopelta aegis TaxID=2794938 RepID=UPI0018DD6606|nr:ImmA/IrrE family metallo-endopeptidase [methane-oxidizing endosymbiont of Gigantopelta aegis]